MSSLESATSKISLQSPLLSKMRTLVHGIGLHIDEQDQRIRVLEGQLQSQRRDIRTLQQESDRARQGRDKRLQAVLLGQAAYTLSGLVEAHVYQGQPTGELQPLSLKQLAAKHSAQQLTPEQAERWLHAQALLGSTGMPVNTLIQADKVLRKLRYEPAHGSSQQRNSTNMALLIQWADVHIDAMALGPVKEYLKVLNRFSSSNKPLCPDKSLGQL